MAIICRFEDYLKAEMAAIEAPEDVAANGCATGIVYGLIVYGLIGLIFTAVHYHIWRIF